jgi:hypothetical protein
MPVIISNKVLFPLWGSPSMPISIVLRSFSDFITADVFSGKEK